MIFLISFWSGLGRVSGAILELKIDMFLVFFRFTTPLEAQRKLDESSVASRSLSFGFPSRFRVFFGAQVTPKFGQNLGPKRNVTYNRQNAQNTIKTGVFLRFFGFGQSENRSKINPKSDRKTK